MKENKMKTEQVTTRIVNKRGTPLTAFHSNGGWEIRDVFPCSHNNYMIFNGTDEANKKIKYIIQKCEDQRSRWGDWTDKALKYANSLSIEYRENGLWYKAIAKGDMQNEL